MAWIIRAYPLSSDYTFVRMSTSLATEKIKCSGPQWACSSWPASDQLASRKSLASGKSGNQLICAPSLIDLPDIEWVQYIKINFMAFLFGGAVQFLWLESLYQQSNVGKGLWKFKAIVILACLGIKGCKEMKVYMYVCMYFCSLSEQLLYY